MKHVLAVVVMVGSSCNKADPVAAPPPAPAPMAVAGDPQCADKTAKLKTWLADLVAEGSPMLESRGIALAKLEHEGPRPIPRAPVLFIGPTDVTFQGQLVSTLPITDRGAAVTEALAANPSKTDTVVVIDGTVPWPSVVAATTGAVAGGRTHLTFVVAAGTAGKATPPPPSAIDADLDALEHDTSANKARKLASPGPNISDRVFKDCPVKELYEQMSKADDKNPVLVDGLPKAIAACGCRVEIASVQRLVWSWFDRDMWPAMLAFTVDVDAKGKPVASQATWAASAQAVADAAKSGKVAFK